MKLDLNGIPDHVKPILQEFAGKIINVQPGLVEGIYITGSIPLNDYHSKKSDIDFIAILSEIPDKTILEQIEEIHIQIEKRYHKPKVNGYYLNIDSLNNEQHCFPSFYEGEMHMRRRFEYDKVQLLELQTTSINIFGVPASELPLNVSLKDVMKQLHQNINSYWTRWITKHSSGIAFLKLSLVPGLTEWGVLGVVRQLYTLETGKITSKLNAGIYFAEKLPEVHKPAMKDAICERGFNGTRINFSPERARRTLECMKFIQINFNKIYEEKYSKN